MKSLVVGAMLLHSMNAQLVPAAGADTAPAPLLTPADSPLVLPPQPPALAAAPAADAAPAAFVGAPNDQLAIDPVAQPAELNPAVDFTATAVVDPTVAAPAAVDDGAVLLADPAVSDTAMADPAVVDPTVANPTVADPAAIDNGEAFVGTLVPLVGAAPVDATPAADPAPVLLPIEEVPTESDPASVDAELVVPVEPDVSTPAASPIDTTIVDPIATPVAAPVDTTPVVGPVAAPIDTSPVEATSTPLPIGAVLPVGAALPIGSNPYFGPYEPNSIYDPNSPYYDPYAQPPGWEGEDNGIYDGEDDNAYQGGQHDGKAPIKNPGYDYHEGEECPAWCHPEDDSFDPYPTSTPDYDYSPYQPTPTPEYPDYQPVADPYPKYEKTPEYIPYPKVYPTPSPRYAAEPYQEEPYPAPTPDYEAEPQYYPEPEDKSYPQLKKVRSILRAVRRQVFNWPQAAYPQPTYPDDDDSGAYDGEDGSIPDWLYDISGAPKRPAPTPKPKPKCPKSCYKPKTTADGYATKPARPTYTKTRKGSYKTTEDPYQATEEPYYQESTTEGYYPDQTTDAPYADYTSSIWYPQGNSSALYLPTGPTDVPSEPTSIPDEPTSVPYEPAVAPYVPTTLATQYQPQAYPEQTGGGWSDPGSPAGDYTGETLDTLCPNTCNPFNPAENLCDVTTGCATTGGSKYYCACRAGFRADNYNAKDFSKQFKVAGQPYVYLAVSTSCNTPCSDQTCSEVLERSQCK